jgi:hypothetical protein
MGWILKCALMSENTKHFKSCRYPGRAAAMSGHDNEQT